MSDKEKQESEQRYQEKRQKLFKLNETHHDATWLRNRLEILAREQGYKEGHKKGRQERKEAVRVILTQILNIVASQYEKGGISVDAFHEFKKVLLKEAGKELSAKEVKP